MLDSRSILAVIIASVLAALPAALNAQVEKRVVFAKGKYSATYQGRLPRNYADYDAYVFRAKRGQILSFKLTTTDPNAYVAVYETQQELGPDEDTITADAEYPRVWSGKLPVTSEYSVQVYGVRRDGAPSGRAPYTIEIAIRNTPAQTAGRPELPNDLTQYVGEYPVTLMKIASVKRRLQTLLGKSYSDFEISIDVQSAVTRDGDFLLASGCMPHACTINEAAFVIDLKNRRIHAALYEKDAPAKYFNEDKAATPQVLIDWVRSLTEM
jgi:hypothetical protein